MRLEKPCGNSTCDKNIVKQDHEALGVFRLREYCDACEKFTFNGVIKCAGCRGLIDTSKLRAPQMNVRTCDACKIIRRDRYIAKYEEKQTKKRQAAIQARRNRERSEMRTLLVNEHRQRRDILGLMRVET